MSRKLLGKVVAAAGLGAASLMICVPGAAAAEIEYPLNSIYAEPKGVKPGDMFKVFLRCTDAVENPFVSSLVTGKLGLKPLLETDNQPPVAPDGGQQPALPPGDEQSLLPDAEEPLLPDGEQSAPGAAEQGEAGAGGQAVAEDAAEYWGLATVPPTLKPGHYAITGSCGKGTIVVLPKGSVQGGDGGATTDPGRTAAGAGLLGAAAIGGFLMIRRRRTDGALS